MKNTKNLHALQMRLTPYIFVLFSLFFFTNSFAQDCNLAEAKNYFEKGLKCHKAEEYEDAAEWYSKAVEYCPENWLLHINWGIALVEWGAKEENVAKTDEGIEKIKFAVELSDQAPKALLNLATAMEQAGKMSNSKTQIEEGISMFRSIENEGYTSRYLYSNWAAALINLSIIENNTAEKEDDIVYMLHKAYATAPADAALNFACLYSLLKKKKEAIMWLKEALFSEKKNLNDINSEDDLDGIRNEEEYKQLIKIRSEYETDRQLLSEKFTDEQKDNDSTFIYSNLQEELWVKYLNKLDNYYNTDTLCSDFELKYLPSFPGGEDAMDAFIEENINYPEEVDKYNVSGIVRVQFNVDKEGEIKNIKIVESIYKNHDLSEKYDKEVIRLIEQFPKWIPANNGKENIESCEFLDIYF